MQANAPLINASSLNDDVPLICTAEQCFETSAMLAGHITGRYSRNKTAKTQNQDDPEVSIDSYNKLDNEPQSS